MWHLISTVRSAVIFTVTIYSNEWQILLKFHSRGDVRGTLCPFRVPERCTNDDTFTDIAANCRDIGKRVSMGFCNHVRQLRITTLRINE